MSAIALGSFLFFSPGKVFASESCESKFLDLHILKNQYLLKCLEISNDCNDLDQETRNKLRPYFNLVLYAMYDYQTCTGDLKEGTLIQFIGDENGNIYPSFFKRFIMYKLEKALSRFDRDDFIFYPDGRASAGESG